jgi:hypothetical protein
VGIEQRPAIVEERSRLGDREGGTSVGPDGVDDGGKGDDISWDMVG